MWSKDPVKALEGLSEEEITAPLPAKAPVLGKPTLRAHLGLVPEATIGRHGSAQRKQAEDDLGRAFLQQQQGHIMACAPVRAGGEGSHSSQMEYLFHSTAAATEARQQLRDSGGATLILPTAQQPIFVPCLDGPGRLPSTLVRVVVSGLPADFMIPGAIRVLLECAGYVTGGAEGVIVRAEHGGEHRADISAFAPDVMKLGVLVGIVRPPASDPTLARLPRAFADVGGAVSIRVAGSTPQQPGEQPMPALAQQAFVPASSIPQHPPPNPRQVLLRPLDAVIDLHGRSSGDRRGLGMPHGRVPLPGPPAYPPGFGSDFTAATGPPMPPYQFPGGLYLPPPPPPPPARQPTHAHGPTAMEIDPPGMHVQYVQRQIGSGRYCGRGQQQPMHNPLPDVQHGPDEAVPMETASPGQSTGPRVQPPPILAIPGATAPAQRGSDEAVPMETQQPSPSLPDVPLVDSAMRWLEDEEDPERPIEARREQLRQLHGHYPAVWHQYAADSSFPPAPEVRSSLRELGGLPTGQISEERPSGPPSVASSRRSRQARSGSPQADLRSQQTPAPNRTTSSQSPQAQYIGQTASSADERTRPTKRPARRARRAGLTSSPQGPAYTQTQPPRETARILRPRRPTSHFF